jgi:membrane protease YdiL (CAAX protease family)
MSQTIDRGIDQATPPAREAVVHVTQDIQVFPISFKVMTVLYVAMVVFFEAITMFVGVVPGAVLYSLLLVVLANLSFFTRARSQRNVFLTFMLLPLLRLLSLAMPIPLVAPIFQYLLTGIPLLIATLLVVRHNGLHAFRMNLTPTEWFYQLVIGASGIPMGFIAFLILTPPPSLVDKTNLFWIFMLWVVFTLFGAVMEEIIFRGLIQRALFKSLGVSSIFLTSLLYASMFLGTLSPGYVIFYGLAGLLFSIWVKISDSLVGVIFAHSLMNIVFLLFSLLLR